MVDAGIEVHKADIKAMIEKKGSSLSELDRASGFSDGTCRDALRRKRPKAELVICEFLQLPPFVVFPDRYDPQGNRIDRRRPTANVASLSTASTNVASKI